ncbi:hypothetical protein [Streptomyces sp. NPDC055099]
MNTYLQHALDLVVEGVLTQLPAQLITAAVAAAAVAWTRKRKKSSVQGTESPDAPGARNNPLLLPADAREHIDGDCDTGPGPAKP